MSRFLISLILLALAACNSAEKETETGIVETGAKIVLDEYLDELSGKRIGLVMNPTARVEGTHMLDTLLALSVNVTALFAPEHGFRGEFGAGETIKEGVDQATGLPVYSLYSDTRKPTPEMLQNVDLLLFDMQGVGARFYTYISTLGLVLEAAAEADIPVWVLDRPNPAGGNYISGWMMQEEHQSFVGAYPIPMAHGMTIGELAKMIVGEHWIDFDEPPELRVIKMEGWNRSMKWFDTGLPWIAPSPNLPTFQHAYMYLGTVLFEATNISEGRGTPDPFLTIGSPQTKITDAQVDSLRNQFPAVWIERIVFTPVSIPGKAPNPDFEGELCYGVNLAISDIDGFKPVAFGAALLQMMLKTTKGGKTTDYIELLTGINEAELLKQLENRTYREKWQQVAEDFAKKREGYLLYD